MLVHWIQYLLLLCAACLAAVWGGRDAFLLLPAFLLLLPLLSAAVLFLSHRRVSLSLQAACGEDGVLRLRYTIQNDFVLPVTLLRWRVVLRTSTGGVPRYETACGAAQKKQNRPISLCFRDVKTGYVTAETDGVRLYDALGLFFLRCPAPSAEEVLVDPKIARVRLLNSEIPPGPADSASYSQHRAGQDVSELFAMHEYVQGDDLRKIHWKLSSKTEKLIVREFGLAVGQPVTVLLESRLAAGERADALSACFDAAVSLAAALLRHEIAFDFVWPDGDGVTLHSREVQSWSDLEEELPALLRTAGRDCGASALRRWLTDPRRAQCRVLYYVTAWAGPGELGEIANGGRTELHLAYAGKEPVPPVEAACTALLNGADAREEFTI